MGNTTINRNTRNGIKTSTGINTMVINQTIPLPGLTKYSIAGIERTKVIASKVMPCMLI